MHITLNMEPSLNKNGHRLTAKQKKFELVAKVENFDTVVTKTKREWLTEYLLQMAFIHIPGELINVKYNGFKNWRWFPVINRIISTTNSADLIEYLKL